MIVDLRGEDSAWSGSILNRQAEYCRRVIEYLVKARKEREIVILGHSMGGVLARMLVSMNQEHKFMEQISGTDVGSVHVRQP